MKKSARLSAGAQRTLVHKAVAAMRKAHAPYSKFRVGAALLASNGKVFTGCNVENASYGLTICAERNAVFAAVAAGVKSFVAIAVVAERQAPAPCGACRQVLAEFCGEDFPVLAASADRPSRVQALRLGELLPHRFDLTA